VAGRTHVAGCCLLVVGCSAGPGGTIVNMYDNQYASSVVRVPVGARVTFLNRGRSVHDAVAADASWRTLPVAPRSGDQGRGGDVVFDRPGVFPYHCSYHGTRDGRGMAGVVVVGDVPYSPSPLGRIAPVERPSGRTRRVPAEYPTIQAAVDAAAPGDLVLIDRGVYREEVTVTTPSLVLRGVDRDQVIIDGEFVRGNGITVLADAVAVENLTARNAVLNGFFWTGVTGFRASYLTASNNGDYGIYAFGSTDGLFEHSYASGSPDSGFYIGQCHPCRVVLRTLIAENNGLGFSGTNAGGQLYVVSSIWRWNRAGIVPSSLDVELDPPQREAVFAANLVYSNNNRAAPATSLTGLAFGNGILLAGSVRDTVIGNVVLDHDAHGILASPILDRTYYAPQGNVIRDNVVLGSGRADLAHGGPGAAGNCFAGNRHATAAPFGLEVARGCDAPLRSPLWADLVPFVSTFIRASALAAERFPDWRTLPPPPPQGSMPDPLAAPVRPAMHVFDSLRFELDAVRLPAETDSVLAAWRAGSHLSRSATLPGRLGANASFVAMLGVLAWWLRAALRRTIPRRRRWPRRIGVVLAGVAAYLAVLVASAYRWA
jgi:plastocyanin